MDEDADIESLMTELQGLVQGKSIIPSESSTQLQAPIKDSFQNSGDFSFSATDPRHPQGHMGVDMRAPAGTSVYPFTQGVVSDVGINPKGGNTISIQHPNGFRTYYAHLSTVTVQKGDKVDNNTVIGTVGTSGNAAGTWPHLHFQVWKDNQIQNPAKYFSVPKFSDLSPEEKKRGFWLSEQAKQNAQAFNMQDHLAQRRIAFSAQSDKLLSLAHRYEMLARRR